MHEAKTRLSELVRAVEERDETVVLCRDGHEVAPDPRLRVEFAKGYSPTEPLSEDEWPGSLR